MPIERKFFDMDITPRSIIDVPTFFGILSYMGYKGCAVDLKYLFALEKDTSNMLSTLSKIGEDFDLTIYFLAPLKMYNKFRKKIRNNLDRLFVYGEIGSEKELRTSLSIKEIEIFLMNIEDVPDILNINTVNLIKQKEKTIIIRLKSLWVKPLTEVAKILKKLEKTIPILNRRDINIIFSSGAEEPFEIRNPRFMRSYIRTLGIKDEIFLRSMEEIPNRIIKLIKKILFISESSY